VQDVASAGFQQHDGCGPGSHDQLTVPRDSAGELCTRSLTLAGAPARAHRRHELPLMRIDFWAGTDLANGTIRGSTVSPAASDGCLGPGLCAPGVQWPCCTHATCRPRLGMTLPCRSTPLASPSNTGGSCARRGRRSRGLRQCRRHAEGSPHGRLSPAPACLPHASSVEGRENSGEPSLDRHFTRPLLWSPLPRPRCHRRAR